MKYYEKDGVVHSNDERGLKRKLSAIRTFYNYFYKNDLIDTNPAIKVEMPKIYDKNIIRLDTDEVVELLDEVASGRRYILFPEGGYHFNNQNKLYDFKAGCFKIALKSKAPIVPVALIDSYKVFNSFHLGPITTYVYYLEPILYNEYKHMNTQEIADMVKSRIAQKIREVT